ncbi:NADH kinase pos5 [Apiotrichum porosum]|uniref:NADH kinase pos5 n=1 Tax=Apiotrichum porosum TaxID=105984 RepID=A0A427XWF5_9TREE|nr:NADH kinase pos5 [Apiotrichum porosum]RSH83172.1 NADH kinase pos5 [Apiotrichum porosum]
MQPPTVQEIVDKPRLQSSHPSLSEPGPSSPPSFGGPNDMIHRHRLMLWSAPPTNVLLIQKVNDERTRMAMSEVLKHISEKYPQLNLIVEPHTARENPEFDDLIVVEPQDTHLLPAHTHLVLTLGGDGTVLHVSNLFSSGECPPVLCFSMGSLGFLLPFHIDALPRALEGALTGPVTLLNRLRLAVHPLNPEGGVLDRCGRVADEGWQVMNEVTLHRGRHPHLTVVDAYFDGQHLTEATADGLLLSTPTGSTAYSLSAGGPISHPETDALLLTPIAPRSLSFRTVVLPGKGTVRLEISPRSRSPAELSIDGREVCELGAHESVVIRKSPYPIPCIERPGGGSWVRDINSLLQFNTGFKNKSLMKYHS